MKTLMKTLSTALIAALLLCGLAACGGEPNYEKAADDVLGSLGIPTPPEGLPTNDPDQEVYYDDEGVGWNQPIDPEPTAAPGPDAVLELKPDSLSNAGYALDNDEIFVRTYGVGTEDTGWPFYGQIFDVGSRGFSYEDTPERVVAENLVINGTEEIGHVDLGVSEYNAWNFYLDFAPLAGYEPITSLEATLRVYWEGREFETYRFIIAYGG